MNIKSLTSELFSSRPQDYTIIITLEYQFIVTKYRPTTKAYIRIGIDVLIVSTKEFWHKVFRSFFDSFFKVFWHYMRSLCPGFDNFLQILLTLNEKLENEQLGD